MTEEPESKSNGALAFALVYFTFFLDNVLLTVLVPIIPDWIRGESLALWSRQEAPLAALLNNTVHRITRDDTPAGVSQAVVGLVLGAKAAAQLVTAPAGGVAVARLGPARVLRAATVLLTAAALVFTVCSGGSGGVAAWSVAAGRVAHGAGAALAGVAGLALVAATVPQSRQHRALAALLGAVALGVLVGYPFGGVTYALWSRGTSFLFIATALLVNLAMQYMFLDKDEYNRVADGEPGDGKLWRGCMGVSAVWSVAGGRGVGACAGAVLLTTSVMAALEPCLPLWIMDKFHPQRWQTGAVFVPDSAGYLVAATTLGGVARRVGAERLALAGLLAVGLAALALPHATHVSGLVVPHLCLGGGLGATDAALVPALVARYSRTQPARVPLLAALLQAASSAAYALGPIVGGVLSWSVGFETALHTLAVLNLLYIGVLYRALAKYPLSEQWGANPLDDDEDDDEIEECSHREEKATRGHNEPVPLRPHPHPHSHPHPHPHPYTPLH